MSAWWVAFAGIAALGLFGLGARWWERRGWTDPRRDPGAGRIPPGAAAALERLLAAPDGDARRIVHDALELCEVDEVVSWRGGLSRVAAHVEALGSSVDDRALAAQYALRMGHLARAAQAVEALPADHWRACAVRAGLYTLRGDLDRAESAWVAVAQLGPAPARHQAYARVEASRRRRGVVVPPHVVSWERPRA